MITRRTALAAALGAGAALALPGTPAAARAAAGAPAQPEGGDVPLTLAQEGEAGTVQAPGFPLGYVGAVWAGPAVGATVRFRTADGWGAWRPLPRGCSPAADRGRHGALVPARSALAFQVEPPVDATDATVVALNTTDGQVVGRAAPAQDGLDVTAVPAAPSAGGAPRRLGHGFRYRSRASWGADDSKRFRPDGTEILPTAHFPVQTLTVHHTADGSDGTDYPARVRAVYHFHAVTRDFGDLGYHLLIDPDGTLYEGRASGPDPFPVFGDHRSGVGPLANNGAHVGGFNAGNVGVALLGDFTDAPPTPAARRTLTRVLAVLAGVTGLDPLGTVAYDNPLSTATATVDAISGHRDWAATECPGDAFHPDLPALRRDVAALLGSRRRRSSTRPA